MIRLSPALWLVLASLPLQLGCSICTYDFTHPASPKTQDETVREMGDCYNEVTKGMSVPTATDEQHDHAAHEWMGCMRQRGYVVVKR